MKTRIEELVELVASEPTEEVIVQVIQGLQLFLKHPKEMGILDAASMILTLKVIQMKEGEKEAVNLLTLAGKGFELLSKHAKEKN